MKKLGPLLCLTLTLAILPPSVCQDGSGDSLRARECASAEDF